LQRFRDYGVGWLTYCSDTGDVTDFVRMAIETHRKSVNLLVTHTASTFSRRAADPAKRPKLEIVFDPTAPKAISNRPFTDTKFAPIVLDASASAKPDGSKTGLQYLWTVERPAPASTYSQGQELGHDVKLKFEPDVPGEWDLRLRVTDPATKEFSETTVSALDLLLSPHPRLGLNPDLLSQIKVLQSTKKAVWTRFEDWLKKPTDSKYGFPGQGLLLGYAITKNQSYFNAAWRLCAAKLYANGHDRSRGLAASAGSQLIFQMAVCYDWGFDALTESQRHDLIEWLNAANLYAHEHLPANPETTLGYAASAYATFEENRQAILQMAWFRKAWEADLQALSPGGASSEEAAETPILTANSVFYASGENLFYSHLFFQRHLAFEAFSNSLLRPNGLALSRRFPNTEETDLFNWVFRQKDNDQSADPFVDVLYSTPPFVLVKPKRLSFVDPAMGFVYLRADWTAPALAFKDMGKITSFADNGQAVSWVVGDGRKFSYLRDAGVLKPVAPPAGTDLQPPVLSNSKPVGRLPAGTKQTAISVSTNEPAACRFAFRAGVTFPYMINNFQTADGLTHTIVNRELNNGDTYTYFVRCMDKAGNENLEDLRLTFSVAH
jgi:hypothetical protein